MLLHEHPDGLTRDDIWFVLREAWLDTDCYRAYEKHLADNSSPPELYGAHLRGRSVAPQDSDLFKERAQKWAILITLRDMTRHGSAFRDGVRWRAGSQVRREEVKAELWTALNDRRLDRDRAREVIQHAYDYLSGR